MNIILQPTNQTKKAWDLLDLEVNRKCPKNALHKTPWCWHLLCNGTCDPCGREGDQDPSPLSRYPKDCAKYFVDEIAALALQKHNDFGGYVE